MAVELHTFDPDGDLLLVLSYPPKDIDDTDSTSANGTPLKKSEVPHEDVDTPEKNPEVTEGRETIAIVDAKSISIVRVSKPSMPEGLPHREAHMLVSSQSLRLVSPVFRAMLRKDAFQEGSTLYGTGQVTVPLPDDNPDAMKVLMDIIHHRNRQVPKKVDLRMLTHLSILVDKYQMLEVVETFVPMWVADVDIKKSLPNSFTVDLLSWLAISWVFEMPVEFKHVTEIAMQENVEMIGECIYESHDLPIPTIIFETIERTRQSVLLEAFDTVHQFIEKYQGPEVHCRSEYRNEPKKNTSCDAMILGSLLRGAARIGIWPSPSLSYIGMNWKNTALQIRNLEVTSFCDSQPDYHFYPSDPPPPSHGVHESIAAKIDSLDTHMRGLSILDFKPTCYAVG